MRQSGEKRDRMWRGKKQGEAAGGGALEIMEIFFFLLCDTNISFNSPFTFADDKILSE